MCSSTVFALSFLSLLCCAFSFEHIVQFHNNMPSMLFANAAKGPVEVREDPDGEQSDIITLLLYPNDRKSRSTKTATALLSTGTVQGILTLRQDHPPVGPTRITGTLFGMEPGENQVSIYTYGDISLGCASIGEPYGPHLVSASRWDKQEHTGLVGTVTANENGVGDVNIVDPYLTLVGPRRVLGRSIGVSHQGENEVVSQVDGCGVIGHANV